MTTPNAVVGNGVHPAWHAGFLRMVPVIRRHSYGLFKHLSRHDRDEAVAEVTAVAMVDYLDHLEAVVPGNSDPAALAMLAALGVWHGERICGRESKREVLSPSAQQERGFKVEHLKPSCEAERLRVRINLWQERLPALGPKSRRRRSPRAPRVNPSQLPDQGAP